MSGLSHHHIQYAGFLRRTFAFWLDMLLISMISTVLIISIFGPQYLQPLHSIAVLDWRITAIEQVLPAIWAVGFWFLWRATPAKMLLDCQVVDIATKQRAGIGQLILRYFGYLLSLLPLGLGFLWILFDKRNQGWHDKLSNTLVIMQDDSLLTVDAYS